MTSGGPPSDETRIIRRQPGAVPSDDSEQLTGIIRRTPTGSFPVSPAPSDTRTSYVPRATPVSVGAPRPSPAAACAAAAVSIVSGWATAVIATSLISGWWHTDQLFCIAIGFLSAVSAAATIGGLISLLLRRRIGRLLIVVGSVVAAMIFAGLFVAGAELPQIVYAIPVLPIASIVLALLPATGRWCR
ncbi:hypothetical protein MMAD_45150 [Mycolicibacterium madagascariense]|uniref:Uncharacterized protein n=1 Tax=Mycolicibacterium madagascariense TaxID=212765 RepID=A0A7I7XLX7_9MYCO|nr:hypothetical protein [Mycolicibacterium madagascariense]MCV7012540.1 hypothetical protein [Mycolicibacterium madagascariense]BBZ30220.1 hypothetical protein MMAD_45150 [Mycolicibacterium madagascariense]